VGVMPTGSPANRPPCFPEIKQLPHLHTQAIRDLLQHLKPRRIDSPLNQAQEIDADPNQFRELLLRELAVQPDCLESISKVSSKGGHLLRACSSPKTVVI